MKIQTAALASIFTLLFGCSSDNFTTSSPEYTDAGADTKTQDVVPDGKKDALFDTMPDATLDSIADTATENLPEAGLDAIEESTLPESSMNLLVGDLIKGANTGIYYYGEDHKRHLFPNENTFLSWFTTDDFNLVKTLTDAELAALTTGKDVTIRPGTHLVKIQSDPKTYAITNCAQLHWIESEAIMAALYGPNWAARIVDVPDSIWGQYTLSTPVTAPIHPDGQVITYTGDQNRYVVMNGAKRKITSTAAFDANRWQEIYTITTTIPYGDGPDVTNYEPANFWQIVCP